MTGNTISGPHGFFDGRKVQRPMMAVEELLLSLLGHKEVRRLTFTARPRRVGSHSPFAAADEGSVTALLDEALISCQERCLDPVPLEQSSLEDFLEGAKLLPHQQRLKDEGYEEIADLDEAEDNDLLELGLKKVELKRLRRYLDKALRGDPKEAYTKSREA